MVNKRVWNAVLGCNLKNYWMIYIRFQIKPFNIMLIQAYAPSSNAEESEVEWFCDDLTRPSRTNTCKRRPFHYRGLECKSRKSRDTWRNRQIWPWSTEWSRAKANRVLPRERTGHNKHPLPTTQEKTLHMDIPDGQHWNQIDYILCSQRWRSSIQSAKTRQGDVAQTMNSLLRNSDLNWRK